MIAGTKNFRQVMQSLALSVESQFVRMGVDVVADWGKKQFALAALSIAGEGQKTAAAQAGAATRSGVSAGEAAAGQASIFATMLKSITASAPNPSPACSAFSRRSWGQRRPAPPPPRKGGHVGGGL